MLSQYGIAELIDKLKNIKKSEPEFPKPMDFYLSLLSLYNRLPIPVKKLIPSQAEITDRMSKGTPVLDFGDISVDWDTLSITFREVLKLTSQYNKELISEKNVEILGVLDKPTLQELFKNWFEQKNLSLQVLSVHENLLKMLLSAAFYPVLYSYSREITPLIPQKNWRRRFCPVCGGIPDFAYLEKEIGARWLLCSRCDGQWLFQRLKCPHCGSSNQDKLYFFTTEDELYRVYVCEECGYYLKSIDLRKTEGEVILQFERLNTSELDMQAKEKGYRGIY